jgi:hypothetical protein
VFAFSGEFVHISATEEGKTDLCSFMLPALLSKYIVKKFFGVQVGSCDAFFVSCLNIDAGKFTQSSISDNVALTRRRYIHLPMTLYGNSVTSPQFCQLTNANDR